jgi:hypothetical protein
MKKLMKWLPFLILLLVIIYMPSGLLARTAGRRGVPGALRRSENCRNS